MGWSGKQRKHSQPMRTQDSQVRQPHSRQRAPSLGMSQSPQRTQRARRGRLGRLRPVGSGKGGVRWRETDAGEGAGIGPGDGEAADAGRPGGASKVRGKASSRTRAGGPDGRGRKNVEIPAAGTLGRRLIGVRWTKPGPFGGGESVRLEPSLALEKDELSIGLRDVLGEVPCPEAIPNGLDLLPLGLRPRVRDQEVPFKR